MKLDKEQTKKLVLGIFGLIGLLYVYFAFFLGPLNKSAQAAKARMQELQSKLASSKGEMSKAARLEESARAATAHYDALRALSPDGAPIAWFPPRIKAFFAGQQIDRANVRLESSTPFKEKELAIWTRYLWLIDLPQADFGTLGRAIALLENSNPLLTINKLTVRASPDSPEFQQVTLLASTIIDKK